MQAPQAAPGGRGGPWPARGGAGRGGAWALAAALLLFALPGPRALGEGGAAPVLERWLARLDPESETDERVWAAAIDEAREAAERPALARALLERVGAPRTGRLARALALEALGAVGGVECAIVLHRPAPGEAQDWLLGAARARALMHGEGGPEARAALLELLESPRLGVRVAAHEALVALTGRRLPMDGATWRHALAASGGSPADAADGAGDPPAAVDAAGPGGQEPDGPASRYEPGAAPHVPHYYGLPIPRPGSRVVFCLDVSQSMYGHGIEEARAELTRALLDLPSSHAFEIVAFNERVYPWAGRLVRAHPVHKARAIAWFAAREPTSYTNLFDAVDRAFGLAGRGRWAVEAPQALDAVFLLSDGAPNRGRHRTPEAVVRNVARLSERRVPVHTIGAGEEVFPLLKAIAAATGGRFVDAFR